MNLPPAVLDVDITPEDGRRIRLWLPIFLLWPLGLAFGVLALVLTAIVDAVLVLLGARYHNYTLLLARSFMEINETRGMVIRVNDSKAAVSVTVN
jgi:hypothetical protein